jgi:hypothetical protein
VRPRKMVDIESPIVPMMITGRRPTISRTRMRTREYKVGKRLTGYTSPLVNEEELEEGKARFLRCDEKGVFDIVEEDLRRDHCRNRFVTRRGRG